MTAYVLTTEVTASQLTASNLNATVTGSLAITNTVPVSLVQTPLEVTFGPTYQSQSMARDAFSRLRISEPFTLFDSKLVNGDDTLVWSIETTEHATSSHDMDKSSCLLTVEAGQVCHVIRQQKWSTNYQPGKSLLMEQTFTPGVPGDGLTKRAGRFDPSNGFFLCMTGSQVGFTLRSDTSGTPVDAFVTQSAWSIDSMDGTGPSGVTLDWTKSNIMFHDMEWLGVGDIRCGFIVDDEVYLAHIFKNSNRNDGPYMRTPNMPFRYEVRNDGTGPAATMRQICATVISEGGVQPQGIIRAVSMGNNACTAVTAGTRYMMLAIRQKDGFTSSSIDFNNADIMITSKDDIYEWQLLLNPTVAGSLLWHNGTTSIVEFATGSTTNTVTSGTIIHSGYGTSLVGVNELVASSLRLGADLQSNRDVMALCIMPVGISAALTAYASIVVRTLL